VADEQLKAWLRQARADWHAGQAPGVAPCHRRYWLQQAGEKSIKALGLTLRGTRGHNEGEFRHHFLGRHSPLAFLTTGVNDASVPRSLRFLLRQIRTELSKLDGASVLERVDATRASMDPTDVSYRYPFRDVAGNDVAPVDWTEADWDVYQGNAAGVVAAVNRLLNALENRRIASRT
jgi:hypothetical protein